MGELEDRLTSLLSDPDAMTQIMALARSLSGENDSVEQATKPTQTTENTGDLSTLFSQLTGNLDPALLTRLLPVLMQANRSESGQTQAFLTALKPFLREERRAKVDRAAQMAKMIHLAKVFLAAKEE